MRSTIILFACLFIACTPSEKDGGTEEAEPSSNQPTENEHAGHDQHAEDDDDDDDEHAGHAGSDEHAGHVAAEGGGHEGHGDHGSLPAGEVPGTSIYQLDSTWTKASGGEMKLSELAGSPVVVLMFYATCQSACPMLITDVKTIEASLSDDARDETKFLLVTFDPENDTPEVLNGIREMYEIGDEYTLLHGSTSDVRELAAVLGIQYRERSDGHFTHTNLITLLDREGVVTTRVEGLRQSGDPIVQAVETMSDGQ